MLRVPFFDKMWKQVSITKKAIHRLVTKSHPKSVDNHPSLAEVTAARQAAKMMSCISKVTMNMRRNVGNQCQRGPWIDVGKGEHLRRRKVFSELGKPVYALAPADRRCCCIKQ